MIEFTPRDQAPPGTEIREGAQIVAIGGGGVPAQTPLVREVR
jgi:hypothetical protein